MTDARPTPLAAGIYAFQVLLLNAAIHEVFNYLIASPRWADKPTGAFLDGQFVGFTFDYAEASGANALRVLCPVYNKSEPWEQVNAKLVNAIVQIAVEEVVRDTRATDRGWAALITYLAGITDYHRPTVRKLRAEAGS
ncbi:hypothetical protein AB0F17_62400 [Nonomuraea sp. NPDC026600]|uniref:hypothetical protein n=1 Tax=Nonomuraea sp. NPDC026600 TaxID=3155363 RepID=UPI0033C240F6